MSNTQQQVDVQNTIQSRTNSVGVNTIQSHLGRTLDAKDFASSNFVPNKDKTVSLYHRSVELGVFHIGVEGDWVGVMFVHNK